MPVLGTCSTSRRANLQPQQVDFMVAEISTGKVQAALFEQLEIMQGRLEERLLVGPWLSAPNST